MIGVPHAFPFPLLEAGGLSPNQLRELLQEYGSCEAAIARFVGQRKLSVTADTYTHVLVDEREVDLGKLLARWLSDCLGQGASSARERGIIQTPCRCTTATRAMRVLTS